MILARSAAPYCGSSGGGPQLASLLTRADVTLHRREGLAKLTGRERYVDDLPLDGFLWGMTVRSPAPRGRVTGVRFHPDVDWSEIVVADLELAARAAWIKLRGGISYADCFAAALAHRDRIPVLTGDPEFRRVEDIVEVAWLGSFV